MTSLAFSSMTIDYSYIIIHNYIIIPLIYTKLRNYTSQKCKDNVSIGGDIYCFIYK